MKLRALSAALMLIGSPALGANLASMVVGNESVNLGDRCQLTCASNGQVMGMALSPDGRTVALAVRKPDKAELVLIGVEDRNARTIKSAIADPADVTDDQLKSGGPVWRIRDSAVTWSPDGKLIALTADKFSWVNDKRVEREYVLVLNPNGSEKAAFPMSEGFMSDVVPIFSPDSRKIAIAEWARVEPRMRVLICDLDKETQTRYNAIAYRDLERWTNDSQAVQYWSVGEGAPGKSQLVLRELNLADGSDKVVGKPSPRKAVVSPDGKSRALTSEEGLQFANQETGESSVLAKASWPGVSLWSPDSRMVLFIVPFTVSDQNGERTTEIAQLWLAAAETHKLNTMLISLDCFPPIPPSWSADGSRLAFVSRSYVVVADLIRKPLTTADRLGAGMALSEQDEKTLIESNGRKIGEAIGKFIQSGRKLPGSLDKLITSSSKEYFTRPGTDTIIFKYLATPGTAANAVSRDTVIGQLDAGFTWKVVVYAGGRTEVVQK